MASRGFSTTAEFNFCSMHQYCVITVVYLNFVALYIDNNLVILAGRTGYLYCRSAHPSQYVDRYWHFYSLTPGSKPCGFGTHSLHPGISRCPSASRISLDHYNSSSYYYWELTIRSARLSDAGVYTCGGHNPYNLSTTASAIVGIIGKCTLSIIDVKTLLTCKLQCNKRISQPFTE